MTEFQVSSTRRQDEVARLKKRNITRDRLLVLLLGPSASGKSKIIDELMAVSSEPVFEYVNPYTTRPNRVAEIDKITVTDEEFVRMQARRDFVAVNALYGAR